MPRQTGVPSPKTHAGQDNDTSPAKRIGRRIYDLRIQKDWTQTRLAQEASKFSSSTVSQQNIHAYEAGRARTPKFLPEIARAFGVKVEDITGGLGLGGKVIPPNRLAEPSPAPAPNGDQTIAIIGSAHDGNWIESDKIGLDEAGSVPRFADPRWSHAEQFAVRVRGASVNRLHLPNGSIAICVPYQETGPYPGRHDVALVVLRRGGLEQWAIKTLIFRENRIELWASSTDPRFGKPLRFDAQKRLQVDDPEVSLEIKGLVIKGVTDISVSDPPS